ncbi:hypothetical protein DFJ74DRAFT_697390 [Hyaloraphidium curvatum]|nr:hypothetical protein DFJ74DRAFT_697390 [Hyaloraphidium curvatum]
MSRGMGRGGFRGRGRGGTRTGASSDSRFPAGFDADTLKFEDPVKVFPEWQAEKYPPQEPTEEELELVKIARAFRKTMEGSIYYLAPPTAKRKDIDKGNSTDARAQTKQHEDRNRFVDTPALPTFFPEELRFLKDPSIRPATSRPSRAKDVVGLSKEDLDRMEQEESQAQKGRRTAGGVVDFDAEGEPFWEDDGYDEEEMEEETDYLLDYYADDAEDDGGDGGGEDSYY